MRGLWMLILALGVGLAQTPPVADLSQDARLQKPITVWLRIEPLPDALKAIQKQVGVPLVCPDRFRNEKVAIFVENRPAHEVLTIIAKLFRLRWETYEDGYRVERPSEETALEEEATRLAQEAKRKGVETYINIARRVLAMTPEQREKRLEALRPTLKPGQTVGDAETLLHILEFSILFSLESPFGDNLDEALIGTLTPRHITRLLKGETLTYSTHPSTGVNAIPPAFMEWYEAKQKKVLERVEPEMGEWEREYFRQRRINRISFCYRLSPCSNQILCQLGIEREMRFSEEDSRCEHTLEYHTLDVNLATATLDQSRLIQEWNQWSEPAESLRAWLQQLKPLPDRKPHPPGWQPFRDRQHASEFLIDTQMLELLAWRYGIPIVADAYRLSMREIGGDLSAFNIIEGLKDAYWMRREGDYLLGRRKHYWAWRAVEPPEAPIRELEAKFQKGGALTIDDYARFAAALDEKPYQWLLESTFYSGGYTLAVRFPTEPLDNLPLLRFWATLAPAQRQAVLAGEFLPLRMLTLPQRKAFEHALEPFFPHPNRLLSPPSACKFMSVGGIFWGWIEDADSVPSESGFTLLGAPKKLLLDTLFTDKDPDDPKVFRIRNADDSDDSDFSYLLEEGETIVRKETSIATVYGFRFFMAPGVERTYEFGYFVPLKETLQNDAK